MARIAAHVALVQDEAAKSVIVKGALSCWNRFFNDWLTVAKLNSPGSYGHQPWDQSGRLIASLKEWERIKSGRVLTGHLEIRTSAHPLAPVRQRVISGANSHICFSAGDCSTVMEFDKCINCDGVLDAGGLCAACNLSSKSYQPDIPEGIRTDVCDLGQQGMPEERSLEIGQTCCVNSYSSPALSFPSEPSCRSCGTSTPYVAGIGSDLLCDTCSNAHDSMVGWHSHSITGTSSGSMEGAQPFPLDNRNSYCVQQ